MRPLLQVLLLVYLALIVRAQSRHPSSPCSRVFSYEENTSESDTWYGEVLLSTDAPLIGIRLDVQLDAPAKVLGNWIGDVSTKDNRRYTILNLTTRLEPGPPKSVRIFVKYGEYDTVPRVRSIALNGRQICPTAFIDDGSLEYTSTTRRTNSYNNEQSESSDMNGNNFNPTQKIPTAKQPINNKNTNPTRQTPGNSYDKPTTPDSYITQRTTRRQSNSNTVRPTGSDTQKQSTTINAIPFSPVWPDEEDSESPSDVEWITPTASTTHRAYTTSRAPVTTRTTTMRNDGSLEYTSTTRRTNSYNNEESTSSHMNGNNFNPTQRTTKQPINNKNTNPTRQTAGNSYDRPTTPVSYITQRTTRRPSNSNTVRPTGSDTQKQSTTINAIPFSPVWPDEEDSKSPSDVEWITPTASTTHRAYTTSRAPVTTRTTTMRNDGSVRCGTIDVQATPLVTNGQRTLHGQWPWHTAIYQSKGTDLSYKCGGSLISKNSIITAAHCVTSRIGRDRPVEADTLLVYLGKYHLKLWSEGGVQDKQVSYVYVHPNYNSSDFRADLAILILSSPADFTTFVRPVCLWGSSNTDVQSLENVEGYIVGWGYDETGRVTDELMLAKMPVVSQQTCLFSHPQFYSHFANNNTYCAGFRNGTSVCNGDSGGGMVFPQQTRDGSKVWQLRGIVSISVSQDDQRVCDTRHYVVFTDVAKYLDWIRRNMKS